jgi:hypothetical protein
MKLAESAKSTRSLKKTTDPINSIPRAANPTAAAFFIAIPSLSMNTLYSVQNNENKQPA